MTLQEILDVITGVFSCWPVKMLVSIMVTVIAWTVGPIDAAATALWGLVAIDTLTRWVTISKAAVIKYGPRDGSILYGFVLAWQKGDLSSYEMRHKFAPKVFAYIVLLAAGYQLSKVIPVGVIFGVEWARAPKDFIICFLALTEVMSIIENLVEMGVDGLTPLMKWFCRKRDSMTGEAVAPAQQTQTKGEP